MERMVLRQRLVLAAGTAALLALAACGAKAPPVVTETNTTFYAAGGSVTATQRTAYTYDEYGNQLTYRRAEDGVLVEESVSTVLPLAEALARQAGEA